MEHTRLGPYDILSSLGAGGSRYIAYASDEAGRRDIYVEPFKATGGRRIVSVAGGSSPRWSRDRPA